MPVGCKASRGGSAELRLRRGDGGTSMTTFVLSTTMLVWRGGGTADNAAAVEIILLLDVSLEGEGSEGSDDGA